MVAGRVGGGAAGHPTRAGSSRRHYTAIAVMASRLSDSHWAHCSAAAVSSAGGVSPSSDARPSLTRRWCRFRSWPDAFSPRGSPPRHAGSRLSTFIISATRRVMLRALRHTCAPRQRRLACTRWCSGTGTSRRRTLRLSWSAVALQRPPTLDRATAADGAPSWASLPSSLLAPRRGSRDAQAEMAAGL